MIRRVTVTAAFDPDETQPMRPFPPHLIECERPLGAYPASTLDRLGMCALECVNIMGSVLPLHPAVAALWSLLDDVDEEIAARKMK